VNQFDPRKIGNRQLSQSSRKWLERHISDPYVRLASKEGYLSRAAYKLIEMQKRFKVIKGGDVILDLGAAPGSWSQVASKIVSAKKGLVVALDLLPIKNQDFCIFVQGDCNEQSIIEKAIESVVEFYSGSISSSDSIVNVILSDMAPNMSGCKSIDHLRSVQLCERVVEISEQVLAKGGSMIMKFLQGVDQQHFLGKVQNAFRKVKLCKPDASRVESCEIYVVALNKK
jgi:23S rRNA (uridine2552-2'-O)-methyltransferase